MTALRRLGALGAGVVLLLASARAASAQEVVSIKPGMSEAQVRTAWGEPLTVRTIGVMSYLYYRNDCLKRCGTYDIVFLEHGQVVDAVVRDRHRRYDGIASSPVGRTPEPTIRP
jgi:hypothetical protein